MIKSICLVRLSALGDVLMVVPLVRTLQRYLPDATLTWVISRPAYELVESMTGVEFIVIDKPSGLMDYWRFRRQFQARTFDVLLAAQASFRANLLYLCIRAQRKIGYDLARAKDGHRWFVNEHIVPGRDHTLDGFLKFAQALGVTRTEVHWDLPLSMHDVTWARAQLPSNGLPVLVVNPAASQAERSWPVERYIEVIRWVYAQKLMSVVLTGGPGVQDRALGDAIATAVPVTNLIGKTRPKQLLALIREATLVLCPDTGPAHMATAVGTPVIALHAVTNVDISGPYTYRDLAINAYPEALHRVLGQPVDRCPWGTQVHSEVAMQLIEPARVIERIKQVMHRHFPR